MAEIKIPMYLTCKDGTRLTIPDDNTAIWNLGAPWNEIYLDSGLLSTDAEKYVTYRPPEPEPEPLTEDELIHSTTTTTTTNVPTADISTTFTFG